MRFALTFMIAVVLCAQPQPWSETLQSHNAVRAKLNLPPLVWSDKVAGVAQQWANHLIQRNEFVHRPKGIYGENLFEIDGRRATPDEVVKNWASESANYDYATNKCKGVCGHYTQIVWRNTKEVGCGVARKGRREVWVCNYNPPGNWVGQRPY